MGAEGRLRAGDVAPDFTLEDTEGEPWRLADHLDRATLLVFLRHDG